ncbi:phosphate ABC transporter permease PstA [Lacibacterium aquatile]|uniref:Phosphate transport system permease protein PstA n=1 Tax=Lacibacterium aquatile TaxID=1168082 RepID=A0ABW5DX13_9PROT
MTDLVDRRTGAHTSDDAAKRLAKRYASERNFRALGLGAVMFAIAALAMLLYTIISDGYSAFVTTNVTVTAQIDAELVDPNGKRELNDLRRGDYINVARRAIRADLPEVTARQDLRELYALLSDGASVMIRDRVLKDPSLIGQSITLKVPVSSDIDMFNKGRIEESDIASGNARITPKQLGYYKQLDARGLISTDFNGWFLSSGDSRQPELAGVWGSVIGSILTLAITLALAFPLGVAAAVYLEEFAPKNKWTDLIEVNINNLAAVPSIVFGLLGLAVFLQFFGLPRSAPLAGGVVLALMSLPIIIIASRAALRAVPPSIRQAAMGLGASRLQVVTHHVLPLAMPGILTGTILALAHALGETAPLLMIGMVAFIVDTPHSVTDAATVLPVQIYLWADSPERGFVEKTSAAIMVLLAFLLAMNAIAIFLRKKFERKW